MQIASEGEGRGATLARYYANFMATRVRSEAAGPSRNQSKHLMHDVAMSAGQCQHVGVGMGGGPVHARCQQSELS